MLKPLCMSLYTSNLTCIQKERSYMKHLLNDTGCTMWFQESHPIMHWSMRKGRTTTYVVAVVRASNYEATLIGIFVMNVGLPRNSKYVHYVRRSIHGLNIWGNISWEGTHLINMFCRIQHIIFNQLMILLSGGVCIYFKNPGATSKF